MSVLDWLLGSDPAIRWQALRDLTDASPAALAAARSRVAHAGLGADAAMVTRLEAGFRWHEELGGKPFFAGETEPCINGNTLALGAYFGRPDAGLARRLVGEQLDDGGWNCEAPPSARSSFHSTFPEPVGLPSRWITLRALRVLRWYEESRQP